jgi:alanine dehydrogenase
MIIGVPKEIKNHEYRVALTPEGAARLTATGHQVLVQSDAGTGSGFEDGQYSKAGARVMDGGTELYAASDMIVKVKEPLPSEYSLLRPGLLLFTYLHLAAVPELARVLLDQKVTAIAYETVQLADGTLPLLTPMSEVAGRLAVSAGAHYLEKAHGGSGVLLSGVPGVSPAKVVVLGAGVVGSNAATVALGMGARVAVVTRDVNRLRHLAQVMHGNLETVVSTPESVAREVKEADLVVGAVLVTGQRAPVIVTRTMVQTMRPGSVIVDVSVDQGGCIETTRPTTHSDPVYQVDGVVHYCVTNMPGAVPRTSTQALGSVTLPYIVKIANAGIVPALEEDPALARGLNTFEGRIAHEAVGNALGLPVRPPGHRAVI